MTEMRTQLPEASLTILDRGFLSYLLFHQIQAGGPQRHWLARAKKNLRWQVRRRLGPHDWLGDLPVHPNLRRAHPELPDTLPARAIRYHRRGFRPQTLLTSLLDPALYPAGEIVELYHERWELEIGVDEVKTHTHERPERTAAARASGAEEASSVLCAPSPCVRSRMAVTMSVDLGSITSCAPNA